MAKDKSRKFKQNQTIFRNQPWFVEYSKPVSYTHLDVYKRQDCSMRELYSEIKFIDHRTVQCCTLCDCSLYFMSLEIFFFSFSCSWPSFFSSSLSFSLVSWGLYTLLGLPRFRLLVRTHNFHGRRSSRARSTQPSHIHYDVSLLLFNSLILSSHFILDRPLRLFPSAFSSDIFLI